MEDLDRKIIISLQEDFPLVREPYRDIAEKLGIDENELLMRLKGYYQSGIIRKMGAVVRHQQVGYSANALCTWVVPPDDLEFVGELMSKRVEITHCYTRLTGPEWPYNLYTMIHASSREECERITFQLSQSTGITEYLMLYSRREWKKSSMRYYLNQK